ncbi:hypothetical protein N657DRAFT_475074 [Parathielavia appendiculata]|uniref:Uncharacterized protein n=1 Tax=Parathielavia appendiculata TaxID=2587402 RepID=A0AAN6Z2L2_9PEZI|nr:hypothetical protein N657DRAFT_475074 [Parathielavia appendiculata]
MTDLSWPALAKLLKTDADLPVQPILRGDDRKCPFVAVNRNRRDGACRPCCLTVPRNSGRRTRVFLTKHGPSVVPSPPKQAMAQKFRDVRDGTPKHRKQIGTSKPGRIPLPYRERPGEPEKEAHGGRRVPLFKSLGPIKSGNRHPKGN